MSLPFPISIATDRVILRPVAPEDLPELMAVNGDAEVVRFLPYAAWASPKDAQAWLARMQALETADSGRQYVLLARETGAVIGTVLLFRHDAGSRRAELGYVLGRRHWGQGLMREALAVLCAALFDTGALRRIEAEVNPDNLASAALLRALGFVAEGRARQRWLAKGRAYDVDRYGLLQGELTQVPA